jgi:uncharacterized protein
VADLEVTVLPRSSRDVVGPVVDGVLRVHVSRPPADGEANRAVLRLVADALRVAPSRLEIVAGARSRRKRIRVQGVDAAELASRLRAIGAD